MQPQSQPYKILVVDDDLDILTILKDNLALDGYAAATAQSGRQALSAAQKEAFDLIILDLMLPDMDGIQVCRALRNLSAVPIIMLTAKDGLSDKVLGLESGADDYIVKPFDYLELAARITARLRRRQAYQNLDCALAMGNLRLDPENRQALLGGKPLDLTKKEFDILALLFKFAGRAVARETIRQALWPDAKLYKWSRTIDVHVQHLRAKLEDNPDTPRYIVTVQGLGYKLNCPAAD
jgi:DNA-binding response OmpR family regulator